MIGIIGAMAVEIAQIQTDITEPAEETISGVKYVSGILEGQPVVAAQCGIGKVNAAVCAQTMILRYHPELVINIGVGGSLSDDLRYGDIAIATRLVQHDVDTSAIGDPVGLVSTVNKVYFDCDSAAVSDLKRIADGLPDMRAETGVIATGDQFVHSTEVKKQIVSRFGAVCCDMEGGAIAQACLLGQVRCVAIRSISDNADGGSTLDYPLFMKMAAQRSRSLLKCYLSTRSGQ